MVGASIFSIFGMGAEIAGKFLPEAFLLSGLFALLVAYSYAKLGRKIVSNAGPIAFILKGIGDNIFTGALAILLWLSYVISIALFAKGFSGYFLPLTGIEPTSFAQGLTETVLITLFTALNVLGSKAVGKAEFSIVLIKVTILCVFIFLGTLTIESANLIPSLSNEGFKGTVNAAVIFFLSYMGFGLITNAGENIRNPAKNIPRAIFLSIIIVIFIYIAVSVVAVGNLSIAELVKAKENALAIASKPFLGAAGFLFISIGALFSISSALNATLYGGANVAYSFAKNGELPDVFERKIWFNSTEGLYITAGVGLAFALFFNLNAIASITSSIYTIIYLFVLVSHFRLAKEMGGNKIFIAFNISILLFVLLALIYHQWQTEKYGLLAFGVVLLAAISLEFIYRKIRKRSIKDKT